MSAQASWLFKPIKSTKNKTQVMNKICQNCSDLLYFIEIYVRINMRKTGWTWKLKSSLKYPNASYSSARTGCSYILRAWLLRYTLNYILFQNNNQMARIILSAINLLINIFCEWYLLFSVKIPTYLYEKKP